MEKPDNNILVIFGASGDLTRRKLIPALFDLFRQELLPGRFAVLGVSRTSYTDESFREEMLENVEEFCEKKPVDKAAIREFLKKLYYISIDTKDSADYAELKKRLNELDGELQTGQNFIYYLATPPSIYGIIAHNIGAQELQKQGEKGQWKRIIIEKPFGYDLDSARKLNNDLQDIFEENQIYRIDHYLGKETVQNTMALRFSNGIFEPLWNRNYIHHVEVTAAEQVGVGDRGGYYDRAGALRDMVQNHLLQIVGMIAMEPPVHFNAREVRNETVKVFHALCPIKPREVSRQVVRGQYVSATVEGKKVKGYRQEKNVDKNSRTETFVAMNFYIDNWRWGGVPFYIRTGKHLPSRVTEIVIHFKKTPHRLFKTQDAGARGDNHLVIRVQPDEGILLKFGMKTPGAGFHIENVNMDFHYSELRDKYLPEAYERLLLDCMLGDATLYARSDAVEACWEFITPILQTWEKNPDIKIYGYPAGTWGPKEAGDLFDNPEDDWRYPCRNASSDGEFCEL